MRRGCQRQATVWNVEGNINGFQPEAQSQATLKHKESVYHVQCRLGVLKATSQSSSSLNFT
jgi:hypothetical protein